MRFIPTRLCSGAALVVLNSSPQGFASTEPKPEFKMALSLFLLKNLSYEAKGGVPSTKLQMQHSEDNKYMLQCPDRTQGECCLSGYCNRFVGYP